MLKQWLLLAPLEGMAIWILAPGLVLQPLGEVNQGVHGSWLIVPVAAEVSLLLRGQLA